MNQIEDNLNESKNFILQYFFNKGYQTHSLDQFLSEAFKGVERAGYNKGYQARKAEEGQ